MMSTISFVIAETITSYNCCFILNLLEHLGLHTHGILTCCINVIFHKTSEHKLLRTISYYHIHISHGFMECLNIPNNTMCDICNCKNTCVRQCVKCEIKLCVECFNNHNNEYINTCPYCRYSLLDHSRNRTILSNIGDFQMY